MIRTRLLAVVTTLLLLLAAGSFPGAAQAAPAGDSDQRRPNADLRVMTYNIRYDNGSSTHAWSDRLPLMAEHLEELRPDVLGVQEALHHQMVDLATALPGYAWVGQGREGGTEGEYMGIFYRKDRLQLRRTGDFWLSDTPSIPGSTSWGNHIPRMVTWALLQDERSGRLFYLYNTHFDCNATCGNTNAEGNEIRLRSAKLIAQKTARLPHPVLLTGDFNDPAGASDSYQQLTEQAGYGDTWEESEYRGPIVGTYNNYGPPQLGGDRIDWILRKGAVRTVRATIDTFGEATGDYPSDHLPVIADVVVGEQPTGPAADTQAPAQLTGLTATAAADANAITLNWDPGTDNVGVESYNIYASTDPEFEPSAETLLATVPSLDFLHRNLGLDQTWHYRVAAVDRLGNVGEPSAEATATTDPRKIMFEAEDGVPLLEGSAEARSQFNCCGLQWSSDHQLLVLSSAVGDVASFPITMPTSGTFDLTIDATTAGDFATWTVAIDGEVVGSPYDAYTPSVQLAEQVPFGPVTLESGQHIVTFTAVGRNAASGNYRMGIDALHLTLAE